jgi:hypothetical protein
MANTYFEEILQKKATLKLIIKVSQKIDFTFLVWVNIANGH